MKCPCAHMNISLEEMANSKGGGHLFNIASLRRDAYSKGGTYLKLGAKSSIYGIWLVVILNLTSILQCFTVSNRKKYFSFLSYCKHTYSSFFPLGSISTI